MGARRERLILFVILPVILLVCYGIWFLRVDTASEVLIYSDTPEWDLRTFDFADSQFVRARGHTAEYVPEALLTPEEFENADYIVGQPKNAAEYLTSRFRLYVPDGRVYALMTHSVDYADRIFINGQLYQEIGNPAASREDMIPQTLTQYYTVMPENGVIEIVQQVSNFVHREGGNPTGFRIGSIETAGRHYNRTVNMAALTMGCFLLLFVLHVALFMMHPGYLANLYFALFCLAMTMLVSVSGARVITALFPRIPWELTFRVGYVSIALGVLLCMLALDAMFEGLLHRWAKWAAVVLLGVMAAVFAVADTVLMSWLSLAASPIYVLVALYVAARLLWRLRQKDRRGIELTIVLCGLVVVAYGLVRDTLHHNDITIFPRVSADFTDFAVLVFVLLQMTATFHGTMREAAAAKEREQRMAAENTALHRMNQMKSELMSTLTHELRTPLTVMSAFSQLTVEAIQKGKIDAQTTEDLKTISSESKRLADMASDVLRVFRNKELTRDMAPFSLGVLIEQVGRLIEPVLERNQNSLVLDIEANIPCVFGRSEECVQILWNLLTNANTHTTGGTITVGVRVMPGEESGGVQMLATTVRDNGKGISPALAPHLFEKSHSGTEDGAGLGLSICKEIVTAHGGAITVESTPGAGTAICFTLPVAESEESQ